MKNKTLLILVLLLMMLIMGLLTPYLCMFHGKPLSTETEEWGAFGSYLSGIASAINLCLFIYISYWITKLDDSRNTHSINNQKKITLTEFRQKELEKLTNELENALPKTSEESQKTTIAKITLAAYQLTTFFNQKGYIFPILRDQIEIHDQIQQTLINMSELVQMNYGNEIHPNEADEMQSLLLKYLKLKNDLLHSLQQYIIEQLQ